MPSINATTDRNSLNGVVLVTWALADADTGTAFPIPYAADITVQVSDRADENAYAVTIGFRVFYSEATDELEFFLTRLR